MRKAICMLAALTLISGQGCPSLDLTERDRRGWRDPWDFDADVYIDHEIEAEDVCAINGWYGDGWCDEDCLAPDPDCDAGLPVYEESVDWCEVNSWYGDGYCDECPYADPDCGVSWDDGVYENEIPADDEYTYEDEYVEDSDEGEDAWDEEWWGDEDESPDDEAGDEEEYGDDGGGDWCQEAGYYGDGYCDDCPSYDSDCEDWSDQGDEDWCEINGWYGDGYCDSGCPSYDWDCDFY